MTWSFFFVAIESIFLGFFFGPNTLKKQQVLLCKSTCKPAHTWDNFICMLANTCRKPTTASHSRLWARLCWFPMHGPWGKKTRSRWRDRTKKILVSERAVIKTCFFPRSVEMMLLFYLYVLRQRVENLLGHWQSSGEVPLSGLVDDVFTGVVPVKVTDGFLRHRQYRHTWCDTGNDFTHHTNLTWSQDQWHTCSLSR